jgi:hypothetical protein
MRLRDVGDGRASAAQLAVWRRKVWTQDQSAPKTARLDTAMSLGDLIEGDPLGDTRLHEASSQSAKAPR